MNKYFPFYLEKSKKNNWHLVPRETTVFELLSEGEFGWSISVNTSAYYEAYIQYLPCLRYNNGTFENMVDVMKDNFSNLDELEERFSQIPFEKPKEFEEYCKLVDERLDYAIGINTNNYHFLNADCIHNSKKIEDNMVTGLQAEQDKFKA